MLLYKTDVVLRNGWWFEKGVVLSKTGAALRNRHCFRKQVPLYETDIAFENSCRFAKQTLLSKTGATLRNRHCFRKQVPLCETDAAFVTSPSSSFPSQFYL